MDDESLARRSLGGGGPLRLVCIEQVHGAAGSSIYGAQQNLWAPAMTGRTFDLSPTSLKPLEAWREHLTIISNCDVPSADPTDAREIGGDHFRSSATYLHADVSEAHRRIRHRVRRLDGPTARAALRPGHADPVDAVLHRERRSVRRLRLRLFVRLHRHDQLGVADQAAADDSRPAVVFDQMFGVLGSGSAAERRERRQEDLSILDWVRESSKRLERKLGAADRVGSAIISTTSARSSGACRRSRRRNDSGEPRELPMAPRGVPDSFADHVKLMFDLQMLAFRSDITRVFSFKLGRDGSNRVYKGKRLDRRIPHRLAPCRKPERVRELAKINEYHVSMLPYLLKQLKETPTATARCWIIPSSSTALPWATRTSTITSACRSSSPATPAARSREACISRRRTVPRCRT
jgi:hypothetical protein